MSTVIMRKVCKTFGKGEIAVHALRDVDLDVVVPEKIRINAEKYPVALAKGSAAKSSHRD